MAKVKANSNGTVTVSWWWKSYTVSQNSLSNSAKSSLWISGSKGSTTSSSNWWWNKSSWNYWPISSINNGDWTTTYYDAHWAWTLGSKWELLSSSLNPWYSSTLPSNAKISSNSTRNANWTYSYNKNVAGWMTNMKFGKDAYNAWSSYDLGWRNQQIVNLMKQNWIKATDAKSVQDFLEMYSDSYSKADEKDKLNTADKIYKLYNWIPELETSDDSSLNDTDDFNLDEYMEDEFNLWEEEDDWLNQQEEDFDNSVIQDYEDRISELQSQIDSLNKKDENKWLTDEQKTANEEASAAAWNAAQWWNNAENAQVDSVNTTPQDTQPLINSENYWERGTKILWILSNLWYKLDNAPSEQSADNEVSNIMEWWEEVKPAEEQIAESNETNGAITPEYSDEEWLVTSYNQEFDKLLEWWITPENIQKAVQTYLQAKDAAALFTVQNNLSDEAYLNMLKKIKWNNSLRVLLQNYNK